VANCILLYHDAQNILRTNNFLLYFTSLSLPYSPPIASLLASLGNCCYPSTI
jgi:hypothetical protein